MGKYRIELTKTAVEDYWSRRINRKDRLVYSIHDDVVTVVVVSASGHYQ